MTPQRPLIVAGIMSGTSADGIDVAIVRIQPESETASGEQRLHLLHHYSEPYSPALKAAVLAAMDAQQTSTAELARLNWRLGMAYAEAAHAAIAASGQQVELIGCHGQTIYHQGVAAPYAGCEIACTWQLGEMALLSAATRLPVVSNFRPADMAAGGQGAPLVSYLDYALFQHPTRNRILQNLGGIANLTAMPAGADASRLLAFDTGPASMIMDYLAQQLFHKQFDEDGAIAATGQASSAIVEQAMTLPFFHQPPPKSAGREQFGERFAAAFQAKCQAASLTPADTLATATSFTVESIRAAVASFVQPRLNNAPTDYIVAGGGAHNGTLMRLLTAALAPFDYHVSTTDTYSLPTQAKEAAAFALLAYETWFHRPSNVPAATGAARAAILGQVIYCA